ncbi:GNAT family N-acetyltransferase [Kibdelosporangium phytohabitans]|uniref:N-acetyltransferase domain-containing protein n=1 Tax=Kibdelosporangium phytohabitans TaxID=860235 RepID=A0A0N9IF68_9PSEU|nr:GNAT family N-acetyltransferase [Kibdelosporangium phytohabitans]ALG15172.1 hypothetical protein AOZ06_30370 [Kibdelosporangium phytohabitans]MBE1461748.1 hypothetical protein [Kibdelosporangium phytohabitans]
MGIVIERAVAGDVPEILRIRRAAEDWLAAAGIRQWEPGWLTAEAVSAEIAGGEWQVARDGATLAGALRLLWSDEQVWQADNAFAGYVHGLVVDRRYTGLGSRMLDWAGDRVLDAGARLLRLDCVSHNLRLRRYYLDRGFREVDVRLCYGRWLMALFEKRLGADC